MAIRNKELNLFPLLAGADGRLLGGVMKRGLLEEFQVTAERDPTTPRRELSLGELSRDSKSTCSDAK
jgi:hypothetical protein